MRRCACRRAAEILKLQKRLGTTTIYVTHDQVEAMTMGDRIAVMRKGVLQQIGTPRGALHAARQHVRRDLHRLAGDEPGSRRRILGLGRDSAARRLPARAHRPSARRRDGAFGFDASVELVEYLGDERLAHLRLGEHLLVAKLPADQPLETGKTISFTVHSPAVLLFDAATGLALDSAA